MRLTVIFGLVNSDSTVLVQWTLYASEMTCDVTYESLQSFPRISELLYLYAEGR